MLHDIPKERESGSKLRGPKDLPDIKKLAIVKLEN